MGVTSKAFDVELLILRFVSRTEPFLSSCASQEHECSGSLTDGALAEWVASVQNLFWDYGFEVAPLPFGRRRACVDAAWIARRAGVGCTAGAAAPSGVFAGDSTEAASDFAPSQNLISFSASPVRRPLCHWSLSTKPCQTFGSARC